jgi:hypothetical protein
MALGAGPTASASSSRAADKSGTEEIVASSTSYAPKWVTIHATGLYAATGTLRIPPGNKATTLRFVFSDGTLTVDATAAFSVFHNYNCPLNVWNGRTFTISPTQSTGVFAHATGKSNYTAYSTQDNSRLSNGACDLASGVKPLGRTIYYSVVAYGTMTLHGNG